MKWTWTIGVLGLGWMLMTVHGLPPLDVHRRQDLLPSPERGPAHSRRAPANTLQESQPVPSRRHWFKTKKKVPLEPIEPLEFWLTLSLAGVLVVLGGIFAGLTIGLMSLDSTNLSILMMSGSPEQKKYAQRIEPIRRNTHLLLVTLLLSNTIINETLPVLFHTIRLDGYQAVLISTALIVVFGEIIPQSACVRYGLLIGAFFAWPVRILMWILYPIAFPIAKLLDWILGHQNGVVYRRAELKELVALHGEDRSGPLTRDEVSIVRAVLDLRDKTVKHIMTNIEDVFMLPLNAKLDMKTMELITEKGHSRVPIYHENRQNIIGVVLVKTLVVFEPGEAKPISSLKIRRLPRVVADTPLFEMLHVFEEGGSHMALVVEEVAQNDAHFFEIPVTHSPLWMHGKPVEHKKRFKTLGIVTLEDVIEELLGEEIIDETDIYVDMNTKIEVARQHPFLSLSQARILSSLSSANNSPRLMPSNSSELRYEAEDERTPLLVSPEISSKLNESQDTPTMRSRLKQPKKKKEFVEASKLANDIALHGQRVRPATFLSRASSRVSQIVTNRDALDSVFHPDYVNIISEESGYIIDGTPQIKEWSLDGDDPNVHPANFTDEKDIR